MSGKWTEDASGAWQYDQDQQSDGLVAYSPDDPINHAPDVLAVDSSQPADTIPAAFASGEYVIACPTCGTGVHPDRLR